MDIVRIVQNLRNVTIFLKQRTQYVGADKSPFGFIEKSKRNLLMLDSSDNQLDDYAS